MYDSSKKKVKASWETSVQAPPSRSAKAKLQELSHGGVTHSGAHRSREAHALWSAVANGPSTYPGEELAPRSRPEMGLRFRKPPRQNMLLRNR